MKKRMITAFLMFALLVLGAPGQAFADDDGLLHGQMLEIRGQIAAEFLNFVGQFARVADVAQAGHGFLPVDGAVEGQQMLIGVAVVIRHMHGL